jgi:ABC-type Mn2+/Zn2+ transport system ATPase subunit
MSGIRIHNLEVKYDQVTALKDVTFEIKENEFLGIIGPNGGGKTTLVKAILGLIEPSSGTITVDHQDVMGYVPQMTTFDRQFPITVMEVILMGHLPKELNKKMTVIMITHDTALMWPYLDRVIYINKTVHLHDQATNGKMTEVMDTCPIDWFIEGEKIQKELLIGKGAKND